MEATEFTVEDGVATLVLNRPKQKNALNEAMAREVAEALHRVSTDDSIRTLILTGAGGAFCAGGDIRHMLATRHDQPARRARLRGIHGWIRELINLDKPVIAAVDGVAYGAGFSLALAADLVLATPSARFCMAFLKIGL